MSPAMNRRSFFATGVSTSSSSLPFRGHAQSLEWSRVPLEAEQARRTVSMELVARLGLTAANAEAMASRAVRCVEQAGALLLGHADGTSVEIVEWARLSKTWRLRGDAGCDVALANAVGLASPGAATLVASREASLRWMSSCQFGGAVGHVLRHARGVVFLVTPGTCVVPPRRVDVF